MLDTAIIVLEENNALTTAIIVLEENNALTLDEIHKKSGDVILRELQYQHLRHRRLYAVTHEENRNNSSYRNSEPLKKNELHSFAIWLMGEGVNRELIFAEEAGFNLRSARTRGRTLIKEPAVRVVSTLCGSVIFAIQ